MGKHYSTEFKLQAISFVSEQGMSVRQAAEYCGIPNHSQIVSWLQRFKKYGINGLVRQPNRKKNTMQTPKRPIKTDEKSLLLQELEYLRAENAYLKKSLELRGLKLKRKNVPPSEN